MESRVAFMVNGEVLDWYRLYLVRPLFDHHQSSTCHNSLSDLFFIPFLMHSYSSLGFTKLCLFVRDSIDLGKHGSLPG